MVRRRRSVAGQAEGTEPGCGVGAGFGHAWGLGARERSRRQEGKQPRPIANYFASTALFLAGMPMSMHDAFHTAHESD